VAIFQNRKIQMESNKLKQGSLEIQEASLGIVTLGEFCGVIDIKMLSI
jgi:hypothetical protein